MSEFVGRTGSLRVYSYPERRRSGGSVVPFARNFAHCKEQALSTSDTLVSWYPDVGTSPSTEVQITPITTGVIEISGFAVIENTDDEPHQITLQIAFGGFPLPGFFAAAATVGAGELVSIPFLAQLGGLVIGDTAQISVVLSTTPDSGMEINNGAMAIQEVPVSTG